jgi:hypothetical protein
MKKQKPWLWVDWNSRVTQAQLDRIWPKTRSLENTGAGPGDASFEGSLAACRRAATAIKALRIPGVKVSVDEDPLGEEVRRPGVVTVRMPGRPALTGAKAKLMLRLVKLGYPIGEASTIVREVCG